MHAESSAHRVGVREGGGGGGETFFHPFPNAFAMDGLHLDNSLEMSVEEGIFSVVRIQKSSTCSVSMYLRARWPSVQSPRQRFVSLIPRRHYIQR